MALAKAHSMGCSVINSWVSRAKSWNDQGKFYVHSSYALLEKLAPTFVDNCPFVGNCLTLKMMCHTMIPGWKHMICPKDCLGLVLGWTITRGSLIALQMIFLSRKFFIVFVIWKAYCCRSVWEAQGWMHTTAIRLTDSTIETSSTGKAFKFEKCMGNNGWYKALSSAIKLLKNPGEVLQLLTHDHYKSSLLCFFPNRIIQLTF